MTSLRLPSLEVKGFRAFRHLRIERLGLVNLIVGKNCTGKSSLLEALRLYAHRGSPEIVKELLAARDEISGAYRFERADEQALVRAIRHLFCGRQDLAAQPKTIQVGPLDSPEDTLLISTNWYTERPVAEPDQRRWHKVEPDQVQEVDSLWLGIEIGLGDKRLFSSPLHLFFDRPFRFLSWPPEGKSIPSIFVPANGLDGDQVGLLWNNILLTPLEEDILNGLRIIVPEARRLGLLDELKQRRGEKRVPVLSVEGHEEPVPLRSMGEGLSRLFGIALALVSASDGLLLIDEVDSGLHYSVQGDLWRLIFQVANRLNVQVFATTHSWDSIEGFQHSVRGEEGMLIRLEERQGEIVPILFDAKRLSIATRQDIEVR